MSRPIIRRLKPEEEEVLRKREELAAIRATLAERELELVDLRSQLAAFEGRYLRQVGTLYAELDEWKARISELEARLHPSAASTTQAEEAREHARQTYEEAHGEASEAKDFTPSPELKRMYREAAKRSHLEELFVVSRMTRQHQFSYTCGYHAPTARPCYDRSPPLETSAPGTATPDLSFVP
jgi:chromosome segregation ATPase